jgi:hypothetical protein
MRPCTPSVGYHIYFPGVVADSNILILDMLQPSSLPKVKVLLHENIFQTLMVRIEVTSHSHKILPPNIESVNYSG